MFRVIKASGYGEYRKTYMISGGYTVRSTNDPAQAIRFWFQLGQKNPTDTAITCQRREDAITLCQAATADLLAELYDKYRCVYKLDWLISAAAKQVQTQCPSFYESEFGDMVYPFDVG